MLGFTPLGASATGAEIRPTRQVTIADATLTMADLCAAMFKLSQRVTVQAAGSGQDSMSATARLLWETPTLTVDPWTAAVSVATIWTMPTQRTAVWFGQDAKPANTGIAARAGLLGSFVLGRDYLYSDGSATSVKPRAASLGSFVLGRDYLA